MSIKNRYLRPLPYIIIGTLVAVILMYIGEFIANARSDEAWGLAGQDEFGAAGWVTWIIAAAVVIYGIYVWAIDQPIWTVGTREVVYMALGAALYGMLSWVFNTVPVPSVSLVSLRPTVVIPVFFGFAFGPVVGFFTGFMGNVLADALTGWGVFPAWDVANGLMGLIPGLIMVFKNKSRAISVMVWVTTGLLLIITILTFTSPLLPDTWTGEPTDFTSWAWVPALGAVLVLVTNFAPRLWPWLTGIMGVGVLVKAISATVSDGFDSGIAILFIWAILLGLLSYYVFRRGKAIEAALSDEDTKVIVIWGTLGVIVGIGFASIADIWINGYTFMVALVGEFVPAAGPNILFTVLLTPLLYSAWKEAQSQTGR